MMRISVLVLLGLLSCDNNNPVNNVNHSPEILSLIAFPEKVSLTDSLIIFCNAKDIDGDTLVYDWITDARLKIKGRAFENDNSLYHTKENFRVFYPNPDNVVEFDKAWVQVAVRDVRGGADRKTIVINVDNNK